MIQALDNSSGKLVELCQRATESFIWVGFDDPIKIVFKLRFEDMEPVKLGALEDDDLFEDHDRLHRFYQEWLVGEHREEGDWTFGDLLQKHAFVVAELKKRGKKCEYDDELAKPIRKGLVEMIKGATESFVWDGRDEPIRILIKEVE